MGLLDGRGVLVPTGNARDDVPRGDLQPEALPGLASVPAPAMQVLRPPHLP